ncbi:unnamed protein product [Dicrocoelium dendriticum]|nr:unnamed protein product [Dicrocoelium dendriticum]
MCIVPDTDIFTLEVLVSASSISLSVEHSLDNGYSFQPLKLLILDQATGGVALSTDINSNQLDKLALLKLTETNDFYFLRIKLSDGSYLMSSVLACQMLSSDLQLKLIISVNDRGYPIAFHLATPRYKCLPSHTLTDLVPNLPPTLGITLAVQRPVVGPTPETIRYLQRLEKQREEMARAEKGDNRSFLAKYWTYIVPAVILFMIFSTVQDANASGTGGGRQ